jgi:hypothetical protein
MVAKPTPVDKSARITICKKSIHLIVDYYYLTTFIFIAVSSKVGDVTDNLISTWAQTYLEL